MRVLVSLLLALPALASAQSGPPPATFDDMCAALGGRRYISADMRQIRTSAKTGRSLVSAGRVLVSAEEGMAIRVETPVFTQVFYGADVIIQTGADGKKKILDAKGSESFRAVSEMFRALFSGDGELLKQLFDIRFVKNAAGWECYLSPKTGGVSFFKAVTLSGAEAPEAMRFVLLNGDTLRYEFSAITYPVRLSEYEEAFFR